MLRYDSGSTGMSDLRLHLVVAKPLLRDAAQPVRRMFCPRASLALSLLGFGLVAVLTLSSLAEPVASRSSGTRRREIALPVLGPFSNRGRVVVVGAGGRLGQLVLGQLFAAERDATGLVRSMEKAQKLKRAVGLKSMGVEDISLADVLDPASLSRNFVGADAVIVCSGATPKITRFSMLKSALLRLVRKGGQPSFHWPRLGTPEEVDYKGTLNMIFAAKKAGVRRIVLVSATAGTEECNSDHHQGAMIGSITMWKRKAEMELINSGTESNTQ